MQEGAGHKRKVLFEEEEKEGREAATGRPASAGAKRMRQMTPAELYEADCAKVAASIKQARPVPTLCKSLTPVTLIKRL